MEKFLYVFSKEDRDLLIADGYTLLKSDDKNDLYVFVNQTNMNFDLIDPSDAMANFTHNMKFLKTKGFQPITRIKVDSVTDTKTGTEQLTISY